MAKNEKDDYFATSLDQCTKCGSHDVKQTETKNKNDQKIISIYCRPCRTEVRRRLAT